MEESLGALKNHRPCLLAVRKAVKTVEQAEVESLDYQALDALVDRLQRGLAEIDQTLSRMYFLPAPQAL